MTGLAIETGHAVTLHYRLTLENGTTIDDSYDGDPLEYVHGAGSLIRGLERQLEGKHVGAELRISVDPDEGYGVLDPQGEQTVSRAQFPSDVDLEPGMTFRAEGGGVARQVWVQKVEGDRVTLTSNHPLAGETLHFEVKILGVREADASNEADADPPST